jgi:glutamyl-tRNA(Gln) amidotransferase subunit E
MIINKAFGNNNFFIDGIISGNLMSHDYRALGLKSGLEIHQQLDTKEKLFCGCPTLLRDTKESNFEFFRYLRPTQSEMGVVDRAALEEIKLIKKFIYKAYDTTCLVENDEEPPRELNPEAVDISLMVGRMMNMKIVDELYTMRKIVIDGSNTSGFQRTGLLATQGFIDSSAGRVGIDVLCLEEEAAQKVEDKGDSVIYSLDRLGIPLVEIGTAPDIVSPAHAREVAEQIGMILRSTGKVKRGIGTIRQDVNISIAQGARVEIKGVQELALIETIVEREVTRQATLLEIKKELNKLKAAVSDKIIDVTSVFANTTSKVILKALKGGVVYAVNLPGFSGFVGKEIQPARRLGTEFSDRAKKSGVGGIFHTDELPNYGITKEEVEALRNAVGAKEMDCVVMVADSKEKAQGAMEAVIIRAKEALEFIPEETRRALPDGNSAYMRPLPGAARMYPETDVPPVVITEERIQNMKLPELIGERKARYMKQFSLNEELANQIARSGNFIVFDKIMNQIPQANPNSVVRVLETILYELEKEGVEVKKIMEDHLMQLFRLQSEGRIPNEAIGNILKTMASKPELAVESALGSLGIGKFEKGELETAVDKLIEEKMDFIKAKGINSVGPLMGIVMKDFRGKVSGEEVSSILKEKISKKLG